MKVIDARSGREIRAGQRIDYPGDGDPDWVSLVEVNEGIFSATLRVMKPMVDGSGKVGLFTRRFPIRWMHPAFPFQRVVFLPS